jgi:DNA-binding transcriptional regulator LsrR (DeoR family)
MPRLKNESDSKAVFMVAKYFFDGMKARDIAIKINSELKPAKRFSRESVYPLLTEARKRGFVRLVPPVEAELAKEIAKKFSTNENLLIEQQITVVRTGTRHLNEYVAHKAAELALKRIRETAAATKKEFVGLGLGPGRATLDFCRHLAKLMESETNIPDIKLHAICSGCPANEPDYAPISFFNLFPREHTPIRLGLFAETVVHARNLEDIKKLPGVKEAFAEKKEIDIIVTSMGDFMDDHDLLGTFLAQSRSPHEQTPRDKGWIGSVQYRPYSKDGPIKEEPGEMRAVTLFELDDFKQMAVTKNKHVLLIARQCGICGMTRAKALRPLLTNLRLWSELVLDEATARELLRESDDPASN